MKNIVRSYANAARLSILTTCFVSNPHIRKGTTMCQLLDSTNYVVGIYSMRAAVFECMSIDAAKSLQLVYENTKGITPAAGLAIYTRSEWLFGFQSTIYKA